MINRKGEFLPQEPPEVHAHYKKKIPLE